MKTDDLLTEKYKPRIQELINMVNLNTEFINSLPMMERRI